MGDIIVQTGSWTDTTATLIASGKVYKCTLGRGGVTLDKTEGDGKTPVGSFPLRQVFYRSDRTGAPLTSLPVSVLTPETGWCEDPAHPDYNRRISLPHPAVSDRMTRDDALFDVVVVVGYNDDPPVPGKGSAIFIHMARPEFTPTAGCIGLRFEDMLEILQGCDAQARLIVLPPQDIS